MIVIHLTIVIVHLVHKVVLVAVDTMYPVQSPKNVQVVAQPPELVMFAQNVHTLALMVIQNQLHLVVQDIHSNQLLQQRKLAVLPRLVVNVRKTLFQHLHLYQIHVLEVAVEIFHTIKLSMVTNVVVQQQEKQIL